MLAEGTVTFDGDFPLGAFVLMAVCYLSFCERITDMQMAEVVIGGVSG